jgi:ssDNA-binding Zn-finger/Zn-ribbon topoisomerase 1
LARVEVTEDLKPCPNCGKQAGELRKNEWGGRFPYRVQCGACGWTTNSVRLASVAVKLWNDAKKPAADEKAPDREPTKPTKGAKAKR